MGSFPRPGVGSALSSRVDESPFSGPASGFSFLVSFLVGSYPSPGVGLASSFTLESPTGCASFSVEDAGLLQARQTNVQTKMMVILFITTFLSCLCEPFMSLRRLLDQPFIVNPPPFSIQNAGLTAACRS